MHTHSEDTHFYRYLMATLDVIRLDPRLCQGGDQKDLLHSHHPGTHMDSEDYHLQT